ncbi:hypothetical protein [Bacteriovorax sp. Seq25_V]|uniref:hypothetical protein n=1 Tax=Bacteriovorax sp. Seq25_V TaxID=1201288 RepID=UPI00038A4AA3|nr:hypothetical protein [Bacteriovorax sp. Seq25_V]EQC45578.1 hypothetical protein M900_2113 [Bacteriovorax sp. Seq25_V]
MKKAAFLTLLISLSVCAETYEAPQMEKVEWKKPKVKVYKDNTWATEYNFKEQKSPTDSDEFDSNSPERKPSSGEEEAKPKFWDFKSVK